MSLWMMMLAMYDKERSSEIRVCCNQERRLSYSYEVLFLSVCTGVKVTSSFKPQDASNSHEK